MNAAMRGRVGKVVCAAFGAAALVACSAPDTRSEAESPRPQQPYESTIDVVGEGRRYAENESFRRAALVASLVSSDNDYARRRLASYTDSGWGALRVWNPRTRAAVTDDLGAPDRQGELSALDVDTVPWEENALVALGRRAFFEYPVQVAPFLRRGLSTRDAPARYGLHVDGDGHVGGIRWTELPGGLFEPSFTCSTCHARVRDGVLVAGQNDDTLDVAALTAEFRGDTRSPEFRRGTVDVTDDGADNPTAIPDLRPVHAQHELQRAAAVHNGLLPLAIRTETLIVTSLDEAVRPDRKLAFALALYVFRLATPVTREPDATSARGERLFSQTCAGCHAPPNYSGAPVPLAVVGTDRSVGESRERGTGFYRVPSLRGVGDRTPLLSAGQVADLAEMFSPSRNAAGHPFGLDFAAGERSDLVAFLETL